VSTAVCARRRLSSVSVLRGSSAAGGFPARVRSGVLVVLDRAPLLSAAKSRNCCSGRRSWRRELGWLGRPNAFATRPEPSVADAPVSYDRRAGPAASHRAWFLAPGVSPTGVGDARDAAPDGAGRWAHTGGRRRRFGALDSRSQTAWGGLSSTPNVVSHLSSNRKDPQDPSASTAARRRHRHPRHPARVLNHEYIPDNRDDLLFNHRPPVFLFGATSRSSRGLQPAPIAVCRWCDVPRQSGSPRITGHRCFGSRSTAPLARDFLLERGVDAPPRGGCGFPLRCHTTPACGVSWNPTSALVTAL